MRRWAGAALIVSAALLPWLVRGGELEHLVRAGGIVGLYMILGIGLNFTLGYVGLFDLGYVAFYGVGAYTAALCARGGLSPWLAIPLAVAAAVLIRSLLGVTILRLRGDYLAVVTMGFGEITRLAINNLDTITNGPKGLQVPPLRLFGLVMTENVYFYYLIMAVILLSVAASRRMEHSRIGRAWVAIREDETAAALSGIAVGPLKLLAFVLSAVFAGLAGALFAYWEQFVTPESFVFWESILVVSIVVLGGMGSVGGVLLGALILSGCPVLMQAVLSPQWINYRYLFFGLILVLVTLFRPQGLWPSKRREAELSDA
ncbi:MAG: branched-chain amino acid ABC transporter permease [Elusimicrobia bacterium]|nr:branched-chain amino acid ABC transporter permease [Elusimicrobiota bacterium]